MRYDVMAMSEKQKIVSLGQLPQEELEKLTQADKTVLATALIYSLSELIAHSYPLTEDINLKELVQEAALFAVELTEGVNLVIDDITQKPDILH
jgi:hypothetical protein|tara:strand:- start:799 stop:1080 length:282 start_codon:yes stop_codon:yes gene_type:complete